MSREQRSKIDSMLRGVPDLGPMPFEDQRAAYGAFMGTMFVPDEIHTTEVDLAGMRTLLVAPAGESRSGTILFFHGGGFVFGSPETDMCLTAALVTRTGYRAYSPDYRLAPEHPFPAGVNDAFDAYRALLDAGQNPSTIALAGASAGGGLVVTTLIKARDAGLPMPAAIVAFSAGLDVTRTGASMDEKAGIDPIFTRESLKHREPMYLAGADPHQELLTPATLADPTGFPPILLQAGTNEVLLDDTTRMAKRAQDAGVDVILDITADVPHVFQTFAGVLDAADQALDRAAFFLRQHLAPTPPNASTSRSGAAYSQAQ
jgi:monoterpene epsilon-lactone hydrolase